MKTLILLTALSSAILLGACSAREVATGAAAGTAGYIIGKDADD